MHTLRVLIGAVEMLVALSVLRAVRADNIEIWRREFQSVRMGDRVITAEEMEGFNSLKISYMCSKMYDIIETEPKRLWIREKTVNFGTGISSPVRIDYEYKILGLADFVWPLLGFATVLGVCSYRIATHICRRLRPALKEDRGVDEEALLAAFRKL